MMILQCYALEILEILQKREDSKICAITTIVICKFPLIY